MRQQLVDAAVAEHLRQRRIRVEDAAVFSRAIDTEGRSLHERPILLFRLAQPFFRVFLTRNIPGDRVRAPNGLALDDQLQVLADPHRLARLRDGRKLEIRVRNSLADLAREQRGRRLTVVLSHD